MLGDILVKVWISPSAAEPLSTSPWANHIIPNFSRRTAERKKVKKKVILLYVMLASNWCCLAEAVRLTLTPLSGLRCGAMMSTIWREKAAYMNNCSILAWPHLCRYSRKYVALTLRGFGQIYSLGVYLCLPSPVLKEAKTFLWLFFFSDLYSCFPLLPLPASVNIGFLGTLKPM